jgi:retron-type reverse transcriptase
MKIFALLNVQNDDDLYYSIPYKRSGNTRTVELVIDIIELFFINNINLKLNMIIADIDDIDFFTKLNQIIDSPNLIGIHVSLENKNLERHAISVYKCDTTELLYDDNLNNPYPFKWSNFFKDVIKQNDAYIFFLENDYYTKKYGFVFENDIENIINREALDYQLTNLDTLVTEYNDIKQDFVNKKISLDKTEEELSKLYSRPYNEIKKYEEDIIGIYQIVIVRGIILL